MEALIEEDEFPPIRMLAYGCVLCKTVVTGHAPVEDGAPCPGCNDRMGGTLEPLAPVRMFVDLVRAARDERRAS